MEDIFRAEDFASSNYSWEEAARAANAKFREWLRAQPVADGNWDPHDKRGIFFANVSEKPYRSTHTARFVDIKEIRK